MNIKTDKEPTKKRKPKEIVIKDEFVGVGGASVEHLDEGQKKRYSAVMDHIKDACLRGKIPKHAKRKIYDDCLLKYKYFIVYGIPNEKK
jgi:hypothetical protein